MGGGRAGGGKRNERRRKGRAGGREDVDEGGGRGGEGTEADGSRLPVSMLLCLVLDGGSAPSLRRNSPWMVYCCGDGVVGTCVVFRGDL